MAADAIVRLTHYVSDSPLRPAGGSLTTVTTQPGAPTGEPAEVYELLHSLFHAVRREAAGRLDVSGTTPGQLRLLRALQRAGGPRRLGELATTLDVAPRSVTAKVDQAEAAGQVRRVPDPHDRRATLVELTPTGLEVLARVSAERSVGLGERLSRLSDDERAELLRLLRVLAESGPRC